MTRFLNRAENLLADAAFFMKHGHNSLSYIKPFTPVSRFRAVEGHHLSPRFNKIAHKLLSCVVSCIDFCDSAQRAARSLTRKQGQRRWPSI
jgi:hypothetical protein